MARSTRASASGVIGGALTGGTVTGVLYHLERHWSIVDSFAMGGPFVAGGLVGGTTVVLLRKLFGK